MVNIHDADVIEKISEVEGEGKPWDTNQIDLARKEEIDVIYGSSGIARYIVFEDGEVVYDESHGNDTPKAREVGFKIRKK